MNARVTVRYFAAARDVAGVDVDVVDVLLPCTVAGVRALLQERRPALARVLRQSRVAVNQRFAIDADAIGDGMEIAVIPPVAGG